jgi:hypothetical protein
VQLHEATLRELQEAACQVPVDIPRNPHRNGGGRLSRANAAGGPGPLNASWWPSWCSCGPRWCGSFSACCPTASAGASPAGAWPCFGLGCSEKRVRSAQTMQVGPCIPVRIQV